MRLGTCTAWRRSARGGNVFPLCVSVTKSVTKPPEPIFLCSPPPRKIFEWTTFSNCTSSPEPVLVCTQSPGRVYHLVDAEPIDSEWLVREEFGKAFDFNYFVGYALKTKRVYSLSKVECEFRMAELSQDSYNYCHQNTILRAWPVVHTMYASREGDP